MKPRNLAAAVVIIVCTLAILYVSPALLRPPTQAGVAHVVEHGVQYNPWDFDSINNKLVTELRPQWFRVSAPPETSDPYLNYEKLTKAFPDVNVLMVVGAGTMGAYEEGCTFSNLILSPKMRVRISSCGWSLEDWHANITRLVEAFPTIHAWEIWNLPDFTQGGYLCCANDVTLFAHRYFDILKDAYQIIKAHDPNDIVIAFSVLLYSSIQERDSWTKQFVEKVWELGGANYSDAISFYADAFSWPVYAVDRPGAYWQGPLKAFEALTGKPVWITQTSMPSNVPDLGATPESQATFLTHAFNFFNQYSYVKVVFWNSLIYTEGDDADYGLLTPGPVNEQAPKPAYYAFQNLSKRQTNTVTST